MQRLPFGVIIPGKVSPLTSIAGVALCLHPTDPVTSTPSEQLALYRQLRTEPSKVTKIPLVCTVLIFVVIPIIGKTALPLSPQSVGDPSAFVWWFGVCLS